MLSGNGLRQTIHIHRASVHQAAKLVATLLRVARVTAGLAESKGSLPSGLWLTSPAGWLPRTGISSGTIRSVIEYGLCFFTLLSPVMFVCIVRRLLLWKLCCRPVLWHCWLGVRKSIWHVRIEWWVLVWFSLWSDCLHFVCIWSSWCQCHPKPNRVLPHLNPDWFYLSGTSLPRLSRKRGC